MGGAVSVSRSGPDGQKGYVWSISFLETVSRITEGPQNAFVVTSSLTVHQISYIYLIYILLSSIYIYKNKTRSNYTKE